MTVTLEMIKQLREKTGAGVMEAKRALEEASVNSKSEARNSKQINLKAEEIIRKKGIMRAEGKAERETKQGVVFAYVHHNGKGGAIVKLLCETDFVAKTDDFISLAKELAMQATSMPAGSVEELLAQAYIRDPKETVAELIKRVAGKLGENVVLAEFKRLSLES